MRVLTWVLRIHQVYSPGYMLIIYVLYIYVVYSFTSFAVVGVVYVTSFIGDYLLF